MNPATGIPATRVPPEFLGEARANLKTIDLALLGQKQPDAYRLGSGDILGIWIEGVLGEKGQLPPVQLKETSSEPPAIGFPVPVRENGTIALPLIQALRVEGLSLEETEKSILKAYTEDKKILQPDADRLVIVTLMRKRRYHILVVRQESGTPPVASSGGRSGIFGTTNVFGGNKQGSGTALDLPAYQNDVLNALVETGGLPGLDAVNEVVIQRGVFSGEKDRERVEKQLELGMSEANPNFGTQIEARDTIRIPLRLRPGQLPPFKPEDVILQTGDVVFIDSRLEFFSTGGLLPSGIFPLPRDYDLDVIGAMALVGGPIANGGFSQNNLSGTIVAGGVGDVSPSMLVILRKTPGGGQLPIRVDLNDAIRDPRHRVLIQPGDLLVLQQTPSEALTRYFTGVIRLGFDVTRPFTRGQTTGFVSGAAVFPQPVR